MTLFYNNKKSLNFANIFGNASTTIVEVTPEIQFLAPFFICICILLQLLGNFCNWFSFSLLQILRAARERDPSVMVGQLVIFHQQLFWFGGEFRHDEARLSSLFRNERFMLDEMFQRNASKFFILFAIRKPR